MFDVSESGLTVGVFSKGIARIPHLKAFLNATQMHLFPGPTDAAEIDCVVGWGEKRSVCKAVAYADKYNKRYLRLEDGFLRSVGLGVEGDAPLSVVVDDLGIYYDATAPSRLEQILNNEDDGEDPLGDPELMGRAEKAIGAIINFELSKYNDSPVGFSHTFRNPGIRKVLVVDQTIGDVSIEKGMADADTFQRMLEAALEENPAAEIIVKTHPDVLAGKKKGYLTDLPNDERIRLLGENVAPLALLKHVDKVYTVTSQFGFEALLVNKPVTCFGVPFYAGWGLTDDRQTLSRRKTKRSLEQLFAAAYILYPRYIDPATGLSADIEHVIDHLARQRQMHALNSGPFYCFGFSLWKRNYVRAYLRSPGNRIRFVRTAKQAQKRGFDEKSKIVIWGARDRDDVTALSKQVGVPMWRMEDGFLRSIGLGSDLHAPASLVVDTTGIYFDPSAPSDLENILQNAVFSPQELHRARALTEQIVSMGVSKYNVDTAAALHLPDGGSAKTIILVPGQVENDASIRLGCLDIRTNLALLAEVRKENRSAFVVYKPHPDVVSGNRKGNLGFDREKQLCDLLVDDVSISSCLEKVDEVHTMTSLVGFEALLRGVGVTVYGRPFYAGFGLTEDRHRIGRRSRQLTLDELVAGTLVRYPRYFNEAKDFFTTPEDIVAELKQKLNRSGCNTTTKSRWYVRQLRKLNHLRKGLFYVG